MVSRRVLGRRIRHQPRPSLRGRARPHVAAAPEPCAGLGAGRSREVLAGRLPLPLLFTGEEHSRRAAGSAVWRLHRRAAGASACRRRERAGRQRPVAVCGATGHVLPAHAGPGRSREPLDELGVGHGRHVRTAATPRRAAGSVGFLYVGHALEEEHWISGALLRYHWHREDMLRPPDLLAVRTSSHSAAWLVSRDVPHPLGRTVPTDALQRLGPDVALRSHAPAVSQPRQFILPNQRPLCTVRWFWVEQQSVAHWSLGWRPCFVLDRCCRVTSLFLDGHLHRIYLQ